MTQDLEEKESGPSWVLQPLGYGVNPFKVSYTRTMHKPLVDEWDLFSAGMAVLCFVYANGVLEPVCWSFVFDYLSYHTASRQTIQSGHLIRPMCTWAILSVVGVSLPRRTSPPSGWASGFAWASACASWRMGTEVTDRNPFWSKVGAGLRAWRWQ